MVMATPRVQITLRLDPSDYERLVLESRRTRRPACRIVRDLLDAHSVPASGRVA
jgi:predicted DNA-binding protein